MKIDSIFAKFAGSRSLFYLSEGHILSQEVQGVKFTRKVLHFQHVLYNALSIPRGPSFGGCVSQLYYTTQSFFSFFSFFSIYELMNLLLFSVLMEDRMQHGLERFWVILVQ